MLGGFVQAERLYTISVTASPKTENINIYILPDKESLQKKYFKIVKGNFARFSVPAGKYIIAVGQSDEKNFPISISNNSKEIYVKSDLKINIPVERIKEISIKARVDFERILLVSNGNKVKCAGRTDVSEICGEISSSFSTISEYIDQDSGFTRLAEWANIGVGDYATGVEFNKERYTLMVSGDGTGRLYLYLRRKQ